MVIQQTNPNILADLLQSSDGKRRISRTMLYAIVGAGLLHAGLAYYLYKQRMSVPVESNEPPIVTVMPRYKLPPPPPPPEHPKPAVKQTQPPPSNPLHPPVDNPPVHPTDTVPLGPIVKGDPVINEPWTPPTPEPPTPTPKAEPVKPPGPPTIVDPQWLSRPSAEQMARVYPPRAATLEKTGRVVMQCSVLASGKVSACAVTSEEPGGYGFGSAAMQLTKYFKMSPQTRDGTVVDGAHVTIRLAFRLD